MHREKKRKRAAALIIANKELIYQEKQKGKRAAELVIANIELLYQHDEKEKRTKELLIANRKLALQYTYMKKCAANLRKANKQLLSNNEIITNQSVSLIDANLKLLRADVDQVEHISVLREMMFLTSHKLRQPVVQLLGLINLLSDEKEISAGVTEINDEQICTIIR